MKVWVAAHRCYLNDWMIAVASVANASAQLFFVYCFRFFCDGIFIFILSFSLFTYPKLFFFFLLFISLQSFRSKYLETQTAVRNCYERALRAAAVLDVGDPRISISATPVIVVFVVPCIIMLCMLYLQPWI